MNISLELGNAKNKNAVAIVDKKIKELEDEVKKLSNNSVINLQILSKATNFVNDKIDLIIFLFCNTPPLWQLHFIITAISL